MNTRMRHLALWGMMVALAAGRFAGAEEPQADEPRGAPPGLQFFLQAPAVPEAGTAAGAAATAYTLTLKECVALALKNNLDITIEGFNPRIREQDIATAKSAFDPVFSAGVNAQRSRTQVNTASFIPGALLSTDSRQFNFNLQLNDKLPTGATAQLAWTNQRVRSNSISTLFNQGYNTALNLTVSQPLLKNFGIDINQTAIKVAANNREIALSTLKARVFDVVVSAANAFFDLGSTIENLEVQRRSLGLAQDLVALNKARVRAGVAAPVEVTQAEAQAAAAKGNVLSAEKAIKDAEDNLRVVLNLPGGFMGWEGTLVPAERLVFEKVAVDLAESVRTAMAKRPELEAARVDITNKELNRKLARNQMLPDLEAVGGAGLTGLNGVVRSRNGDPILSSGGEGSSLGYMVSGRFNNWTAGLTLAIPLGNRAAEAGYTQSALQEEQSRASFRNLELQITAQVREGVRRVITNAELVEAAREAVRLAQEQLRIEQQRLRAGVTTTFNVVQFQRDLAQAEFNEVQAVNNYEKALSNMERVRGTVLERFQIEL